MEDKDNSLESEINSYIDNIDSDTYDGVEDIAEDTSGEDDIKTLIEDSQQMDSGGEDVNDTPNGQTTQTDAQGEQTQTQDQQQKKAGEVNQEGEQDKLRQAPNGLFFDKNNNLVDNTGKVLATKGAETRLYLNNQRLSKQLEHTHQNTQQMQTELDKHKVLGAFAQQAGISTDELANAARMVAQVKSGNILQVAKDIVAMAAAKGHNITEILGSDVGDTVDMRAISQMINDRVGPIADAHKASQQQDQARLQGENAYNDFTAKHEYSDIHGNDIVKLSQQQGMPLDRAYHELRLFAAKNGLDFSLPLEQQIRERSAQAQGNNTPAGNRSARPTGAPLPNSMNGSNGSRQKPVSDNFASPDDDWADIINSVIR